MLGRGCKDEESGELFFPGIHTRLIQCWWWSASEEGQRHRRGQPETCDTSVPWYVPLEDVSRKESPLKVEPTGLGDLLDESVRDGEAQAAPSVLAWHLGGQ